jgi:uncharacterized phosphosugar-binding protein
LEKLLNGVHSYWQAINKLLTEVVETQASVFDAVADCMVTAIDSGRHLFLFGTGHSHLLAEEGHFRAGSFAAFTPILHSSIMLHDGSILSGKIERTPGLAEALLDRYSHQAGDMIFIFSNSGVNQMPVEMALTAKARNLRVVSLSSLSYAEQAPLNQMGKRLHEVADYAFDNCILPGDALISIEGFPWRVAPASTLVGSFILNSLVAEVAHRLYDLGKDVPVFASANMAGASEHNAALLALHKTTNPHI